MLSEYRAKHSQGWGNTLPGSGTAHAVYSLLFDWNPQQKLNHYFFLREKIYKNLPISYQEIKVRDGVPL